MLYRTRQICVRGNIKWTSACSPTRSSIQPYWIRIHMHTHTVAKNLHNGALKCFFIILSLLISSHAQKRKIEKQKKKTFTICLKYNKMLSLIFLLHACSQKWSIVGTCQSSRYFSMAILSLPFSLISLVTLIDMWQYCGYVCY